MVRTATLVLFLTLPGLAAADDALGKDLGATIALQGQPCGKVVSATRNADSDYVATCENGARYHVYVDAAGRVVVQKL
ncbi:MAG: hypothetical protein JOZ67_00555 [Gammaproteobacteria bacterium]|nr:hypothetical protein [Gammaproteobacteria bacterium]MBV9697757.1 hypothetical protein [Gammaproteobacteria bacterium]